MDPELEAALAPVLRDLSATGSATRELHDEDWGFGFGPSAMFGGAGIHISHGMAMAEQVADVADQIQEIAMEDLWEACGSATWPECPLHPNTHPLEPIVIASRAVWRCARTGQVIQEVGSLGRH